MSREGRALFASLPASTQATSTALRGPCRPTTRREMLRCPLQLLVLALSAGLRRPSSVMPRSPGYAGGLQIGAGLLGSWSLLLSLNDCLKDSGRSPHTYGSLLDFDASLGFPGEGPVVFLRGRLSAFGAALLSMLIHGGVSPGLTLLLGLGCNSLFQGPSTPARRHNVPCSLGGLLWAFL